MRLGLIGRADEGGLAALTCELARHLKPEACLVVELPGQAGRGRFDLNRIAPFCGRVAVSGNPLDEQSIRWLLHHSDVIYTAETTYHPDLHRRCQRAGVKLVLHAMPELHRRGTTADVILNPTCYGADRLRAGLLPVPVARDRLPFRLRTEARTFLHVAAPAMLDRNGTIRVELALSHVVNPCRVLVANADAARVGKFAPKHVQVEQAPPIGEYWQRWTDEVDVLLLPRRYAGLCLPAQEAASCGIPVVALATDVALKGLAIRVPAVHEQTQRFAGGSWHVNGCSPEDLAACMDSLLESPGAVESASALADEWAEGISWETLKPRYEELLA